MITEDLQPWLIEINSSPSMARTTRVTAELVDCVLEDTVKGSSMFTFLLSLIHQTDFTHSDFLQHVHNACSADRCNSHGRSVSLSVCPSVCQVPVFCPDR